MSGRMTELRKMVEDAAAKLASEIQATVAQATSALGSVHAELLVEETLNKLFPSRAAQHKPEAPVEAPVPPTAPAKTVPAKTPPVPDPSPAGAGKPSAEEPAPEAGERSPDTGSDAEAAKADAGSAEGVEGGKADDTTVRPRTREARPGVADDFERRICQAIRAAGRPLRPSEVVGVGLTARQLPAVFRTLTSRGVLTRHPEGVYSVARRARGDKGGSTSS